MASVNPDQARADAMQQARLGNTQQMMTVNGQTAARQTARQALAAPTPVAAKTPPDTAIGRANAGLDAVNAQLGEYLEGVRQTASQYSEEGLKARLAGFGQTAQAQAVEEHRRAAHERAAQLKAEADAILRNVSTVGDSVAEQLKAQRDWARRKALLDNETNIAKVAAEARRLVESSDRGELPTLLEELPDYLASRNVPVSAINPAAEHRVPEYRAAQQKAQRAEMAAKVIDSKANAVGRAIAAGNALPDGALPSAAAYDPDGK